MARSVFFLTALFLFQAVFANAADHHKVTASELIAIMEAREAVTLIDVRTPEEYGQGHIHGAVLVPLDTIKGIKKLPGSEGRVIIYCRSGKRSLTAIGILADKGITSVEELEGGINAWKAAGGPLTPLP
ncbi:MAG: rhodanese-like domain-containing protein [Deltaproteobacteria bacterium]